MSISWLKRDHTLSRVANGYQTSDIATVSNTPQGNDQWLNWDFEVDPGVYRLSFISADAVWGNYFSIGTVSVVDQPNPMRPEDRFGDIVWLPKNYINRAATLQPITFHINEGQILRIESWSCDTGRTNGAPLPEGLSHWVNYLAAPNFSNIMGGLANSMLSRLGFSNGYKRENLNNFGYDFRSVSRRWEENNTLVFGAEDGVDSDFNDLRVRLELISNDAPAFYASERVSLNENQVDSRFQLGGISYHSINESASIRISPEDDFTEKTTNSRLVNLRTWPAIGDGPGDGLPPWVRYDHTIQLIRTMQSATIDRLPEGDVDFDKANRLLTIFDEAKVEFRYIIGYYNRYVPVIILAPMQRKGPSTLPDKFKVALSEADKQQACVMEDRFKLSPAAELPARAYELSSKQANWDVLQVIIGRVANYKDIIMANGDITAISKSFTLGLTSTLIGAGDLWMQSSGNKDATLKMLLKCSGFILSALGTDLALPLGLGYLGLVSTIELFAECRDSINPGVAAFLKSEYDLETRKKLSARTLSKDRELHGYEYRDSNLMLDRGNGVVDNNHLGDIRSRDFSVNGDNHRGNITVEHTIGQDGRECYSYRGDFRNRDGNWEHLEGHTCEMKNGRETESETLP